ncbi:MAG: ATP-binding protein [Acidobacteriota bacterium]
MPSSAAQSPVNPTPLASVLITAELTRRARRPPNDAAVNDALVILAQTMANAPEQVLQKLVETALELCQAHSSGISLLEEEGGRDIFRWHGVAGAYAPHLWGTTPRDFSPCGTVLDTDAVQLMSKPDRFFEYFAEVSPRIEEALLIPFHLGGKAVGTIWVISHAETRAFDAEDARVMKTLGEFAAAAYQMVRSLKALKDSKLEVEKINNNLLRSNELLTESDVALKLVNADLSQFALAVSHDLQEPLRTITAFSELLRDKIRDKLDAKTEKLFDIIAGGSARMRSLIQDLLEFTNIGEHRTALFHETSLDEVLAHTLSNLRGLIDRERANVTFTTLPTVWANKAQMVLLFQNLISNAIKYRRKEVAPEVHVSAEREKDCWIISVRDNGEGFSKEYAETIFTAFKRLHGREISGTGLGLALCHKIAERHGGTIYATSKPGEGSIFSVTLPVSDAVA